MKITFACRTISKEELIRCAFDLDKTEYKILMVLSKQASQRGMTIAALSRRLGKERTTIQKGMRDLLRRKLVQREKRNLPRGGFLFLYRVRDKKQLKTKVREIVFQWYQRVRREIARW